MTPYWVTFRDGSQACVEAKSPGDATVLATNLKGKMADKAERLPYPASPVLNADSKSCPTFCFQPNLCVNRSCCPRSYACSE